MSSTSSDSLSARCQQLLADHPLRSARLLDGQHWSWIDTCEGRQTLLLLPGFMGEAATSFLYIEALAPQARVVSVSFPPEVGQVAALCDGLAALLDCLEIRQAILLGGSSSGFLAQSFVRRHPARCSGLILTHTGLPSRARARTARAYLRLLHLLPFGLLRRSLLLSVYAYFPRRGPSHAFWRAHFQQVVCGQTAQALHSRLALMDDFHSHTQFAPGDLAGWPGPILLMEMSRDRLTTLEEQLAMRSLYPTAHLHVLPATAHFDSVEQPEPQIAVLSDFLRSIAP